jgi:hypothetical protein
MLGLRSGVNSGGQTIWIAVAHRDGRRFVAHADQKADSVLGTGIGDFALLGIRFNFESASA